MSAGYSVLPTPHDVDWFRLVQVYSDEFQVLVGEPWIVVLHSTAHAF